MVPFRIVECQLKTYSSTHAEAAYVNFFLLFLLADNELHELLSLFNHFSWIAYISPFFAAGTTEVLVVQSVDIGLAFLGDPNGKVGWAIGMWVEAGEEEQDGLGGLDRIEVVVVMKLAALVVPLAVLGIVFAVEGILALLLLGRQHVLNPLGPLL